MGAFNKAERCVTGSSGRILLGMIFVAGVLTCTNARALMLPISTATLVDLSSCIVEGQVTGVSSRWTADGSLIVTEVAVEVTDALLGETNRVTFLYEGGVVGELGLRVSDTPAVKSGQQILVFLRDLNSQEVSRDIPPSSDARSLSASPGRRYMLAGSAQGLYRIEAGRALKDGFTVLKSPAIAGNNQAAAVSGSGAPAVTSNLSVVEGNVDLAELKTRIRQHIKATRQTKGTP